MKRLAVLLVAILAVASLLVAGCTQSSPAASPTKAPEAAKAAEPTKASAAASTAAPAAAPTKAAEPTKPAAAAPTWPEKGKAIMINVPWSAGDTNDLVTRLLAGYLEKELGTPVQVVNKPGAATVVGLTELVKAKPDGYNLGSTSTMTTVVSYMDAEKKATYSRKDFTPIAVMVVESPVLAVKADSPYKTFKDLVDAAKANPEKIKIGDNGLLSPTHMGSASLAKAAGVKWASVHFDGGAQNVAACLGGHTDGISSSLGPVRGPAKNGDLRILGIMDTQPSAFIPDVKPFSDQGYKVVIPLARGIIGPAGLPKNVVDTMSAAIKKITENPEFKQKAENGGFEVRYWDTAQFTKHWDEMDQYVKPMLEELSKEEVKK